MIIIYYKYIRILYKKHLINKKKDFETIKLLKILWALFFCISGYALNFGVEIGR
jgi:hypothetical protein